MAKTLPAAEPSPTPKPDKGPAQPKRKSTPAERLRQRDRRREANTPALWAKKKWKQLNQRTANGTRKHLGQSHRPFRWYTSHGVRLEITLEQFRQFVRDNWQTIQDIKAAGGVPSLDRIDPDGHYSVGNIQIIPITENLARRRPTAPKPSALPSDDNDDMQGLTTRPCLCSNPDIKGAREWLIDAIARRALEIMKEQSNG